VHQGTIGPSKLTEIHALGLPALPESDFQREESRTYAESARFQEKQLSLKEQAIRKNFKIITSRVNETNIDRLAKAHGILEVLVLFVAGMRSDPLIFVLKDVDGRRKKTTAENELDATHPPRMRTVRRSHRGTTSKKSPETERVYTRMLRWYMNQKYKLPQCVRN
jgi:hypothetical protein